MSQDNICVHQTVFIDDIAEISIKVKKAYTSKKDTWTFQFEMEKCTAIDDLPRLVLKAYHLACELKGYSRENVAIVNIDVEKNILTLRYTPEVEIMSRADVLNWLVYNIKQIKVEK